MIGDCGDGMVGGVMPVMADVCSGYEDGPVLVVVVMPCVGEKPWGLVGNGFESVFESW